jgi:hypothetical protein
MVNIGTNYNKEGERTMDANKVVQTRFQIFQFTLAQQETQCVERINVTHSEHKAIKNKDLGARLKLKLLFLLIILFLPSSPFPLLSI